MSKLNHGRPMFKATDAGGGERIRTITEELHASRRSRASAEPKRCRCCRSLRQVTDGACRACLADEQIIRSASRRLNPRKSRKANAQGRLKSQEPAPTTAGKAALKREVEEAKARIAARKARVASSGKPPRTAKPTSTAPRSVDLRSAERAVEAARKELLLATTDWEKDVLRPKYARAQAVLSELQRQLGARRSLP